MVLLKLAILICLIVVGFIVVAGAIVISLISTYLSNQSVPTSAYLKCLSVASKFATTVSNGPVANITATTGVNVTCSQIGSSSCPGTMINGVCTWQRKLAVTCINNSTVRIRIQSNALPGRCAAIPSYASFAEQNIDFEVDFNPTVDVNSPTYSPTTSTQLDTILCNITSHQSVPSTSNIVYYSSQMVFNTLAGLMIDNMPILNPNSADNIDPFYPPAGYSAETVDTCLSHPNSNNMYHYHSASGCAISPPTGNISICSTSNGCSNDISNYLISTFPSSAKKLTVIGIAKDGHVIYGPYLSSDKLVTSGIDMCNGMFYDTVGNYAYFATTKYPYISGCFGPGNYPSFGPNCTTNGQTSYTKSTYASLHSVG